jgi:hypothetical protein
VDPNKNLEVVNVSGTYKYVYWATEAGSKTLNFKTSLENSDETVTIESDHFTTASVALRARHFINVSVNDNNIVNYANNATATYKFTLSDIAGSPATYPLTVFIATGNLKTSQSGWSAVTGGYSRTYTSAPSGVQTVAFTSNKAISRENVTISAPGFVPTTIHYENVLTQNVTVTGSIRYGSSSQSMTYASITSSNTALVANFRTSLTGSTYSFPIKLGAKLSDMVTFSATILSTTYNGSYTVEQLLANPAILLR